MPTLDSDQVARALLDKMQATTEDRRHKFFYICDDEGRRIAQTWISHGRRHAISGSLVTQMARQLRLDTSINLVNLVRCPLSRDEALAMMQENRAGPSDPTR